MLTKEILDEGRAFVKAKDLDGLMGWINKNTFSYDKSLIRKTFGTLFNTDNVERAVRLFDVTFEDHRPGVLKAAILLRIGCLLFVALGILGGIVYLIRIVFF